MPHYPMPDSVSTAHSLHVLALERDAISKLALFYKPEARLFEAFQMPAVLQGSKP